MRTVNCLLRCGLALGSSEILYLDGGASVFMQLTFDVAAAFWSMHLWVRLRTNRLKLSSVCVTKKRCRSSRISDSGD